MTEKYGASAVKFSDTLRDLLKTLDLPESRENIQKISTSVRNLFGEDILARAVAKRAKNINSDIVVIDGIRRLEDLKYLSENPTFKLAAISADIKTRYERIIKRDENSDDKNKTFEAFVADHNYETEVTIKDVEEKAEIAINNDGPIENLYSQLDAIVISVVAPAEAGV